jgi:soluble lytic murein transglycosylase-like protein
MSEWYGLDPRLVLSVIAVESNFRDWRAVAESGCGPHAIDPRHRERFNVRNAYDTTQNLRGGMRYLRWLLSYYRGDVVYALAAYNAGERRVDRLQGVPPFPETRDYVRRVNSPVWSCAPQLRRNPHGGLAIGVQRRNAESHATEKWARVSSSRASRLNRKSD